MDTTKADVRIQEIRIEGLTSTRLEVVLVELDIRPPAVLTVADLENAIQRVWNLNLFVQVHHKLENDVLTLKLEERWTLVPIAKFGGGGGVSFFSLGVYDPNVFGRFFELGGQYERLGGQNSFVAWFRRPHFLGDRRARIGGDVWSISRLRLFYENDRREAGGFIASRRRYNLFYDYFVTDFFRPGIAIDIQQDETSDAGLPSSMGQQNRQSQKQLNTSEDFHFVRLYTTIGRQDIEEELIRGWAINPSLHHQINEPKTPLTSFRADLLWAKVFNGRRNLAYRFSSGYTSRSTLAQDFFIGGLEHLRGFLDSQFQVTKFAFQNLEYRFPLTYNTRFTLQQVVFHDLGQLDGTMGVHFVQAAGTGLRFIFPKVYRLNLRLDFGYSYGNFPGSSASFGLQQLF